jgi:putative DNA methylase
MTYRKKLIEVSLPLEAINKESAREKSIRHGHPSTLHLWWSRKPLAACRAVLFASIIDDPSEYIPDEDAANLERERLFALLEKLVKWENINKEDLLDQAKLEIARSVARDLSVEVPVGKTAIRKFLAEKAPPVLDPFAGGGSIPLEAQRLGLRAYASDLNPVAVLINKALIEIPPKFAGMPPVHPPEPGQRQDSLIKKEWKGAEGLAEDVRYYGTWMRDEAEKRLNTVYSKYTVTDELLSNRPDLINKGLKTGEELTVIAWLWARSVICPNPACGGDMPLISKYWLQSKGNQKSWVEPQIDKKQKTITFQVMTDKSPNLFSSINTGSSFINNAGKKTKATFKCVICSEGIVKGDYIDREANNRRLNIIPMAIVAECKNGRIYLPFSDPEYKIIQRSVQAFLEDNMISSFCPREPARGTFASNAQGRVYGFKEFSDYFLPRQLIALVTFSQLTQQLYEKIISDSNNNTNNCEYAKK